VKPYRYTTDGSCIGTTGDGGENGRDPTNKSSAKH
jgi:hypothetical protein